MSALCILLLATTFPDPPEASATASRISYDSQDDTISRYFSHVPPSNARTINRGLRAPRSAASTDPPARSYDRPPDAAKAHEPRCGAKKKPLGRQSEVIPKVNSIEMFEIPACRTAQGRPFKSTINMSRYVFLSPSRKTSLPVLTTQFLFIQEYPSADRRTAHQCFSPRLAAAKPGVFKEVGSAATSESSGQSQVAPLDSRPNCRCLPCPACLPGLAPITRWTSSADFPQESVRKGENSHVLRLA